MDYKSKAQEKMELFSQVARSSPGMGLMLGVGGAAAALEPTPLGEIAMMTLLSYLATRVLAKSARPVSLPPLFHKSVSLEGNQQLPEPTRLSRGLSEYMNQNIPPEVKIPRGGFSLLPQDTTRLLEQLPLSQGQKFNLLPNPLTDIGLPWVHRTEPTGEGIKIPTSVKNYLLDAYSGGDDFGNRVIGIAKSGKVSPENIEFIRETILATDTSSGSYLEETSRIGEGSEKAKATRLLKALRDFKKLLSTPTGEGKVIKVYHGTIKQFEKAQANTDFETDVIDRWLGVHYAESPEIAKKFSKEKGRIIEDTINPKTVYDLPQKTYESGALQSDQAAFQEDIQRRVFLKRPDLMKEYLKKQNYTDGMIGEITSSPESIKEWISGGYALVPFGELGKKITNEYLGIMKDLGYESIRYQNTAPMETQGVKNKTSYVKF